MTNKKARVFLNEYNGKIRDLIQEIRDTFDEKGLSLPFVEKKLELMDAWLSQIEMLFDEVEHCREEKKEEREN